MSDSDSTPQEDVRITRELTVKELRVLKEIPTTWTVFDGAWLLDIRKDKREWKDRSGKNLSMAAIIKSQVRFIWNLKLYTF